VPLHAQTHSPSGRYHPDPQRRREIRACDITANIDYYSPWGAPDNDRKMKEASWLCSQAFIESLRVYPDPKGPKSPISLPGEEIAFSGNTNSARRTCREHVETATRRRLGIAPADADWLPDQLPKEWPDRVPEGTWRAVGNGLSLLGSGPGGSGLFGKLFNAGQTCIAPDHVWVPRLQLDQWTAAFTAMIRSFYGANPPQSPDYGRLATPRHHQRLTQMLAQGRIISGGRWDAVTRFFEPTLMTDPTPGSALAEEEIFGPILPILPYDSREELAAHLKQKDSPLSFYVHTASAEEERFWLERVKAGAISFNEHIVYSTVPDLPFGGVGSSGVGHYHGRPGFEAFSQPLPIYRQPSKIDLPLRYPPFGKRWRWIKQLLG
jgi:hypothetical protein